MRVLIGCERFGRVREAFLSRGHDAWSCDIEDASPPSNRHIKGDVRAVLSEGWDFAIFHPDCTYLTNSAAWAYKDPDYDRYPGVGYHQKIKPGTLVGADRRRAREMAVEFVFDLRKAPIKRKVYENPRGYLSTAWRAPDQTIHPNQFGDDASKATCLWFEGDVPPLVPTKQIEPRWVNGLPRWANQTDSGQNRLSPVSGRRPRNGTRRYLSRNSGRVRRTVGIAPMTPAPSIKEALKAAVEAYAFEYGLVLGSSGVDWDEVKRALEAAIRAALATFQPEGERREAIARLLMSFDLHSPWELTEQEKDVYFKRADRIILASGLVQDEAGIRAASLFEAMESECWTLRCVDIPTGGDDADVGWEVIQHYQAKPHDRMIAHGKTPTEALNSALRSARDGGAE